MTHRVQYSRVRVADFGDAPRLCSLVMDYIENPAHAETVTEFVFLRPATEYRPNYLPELQDVDEAQNIKDEKPLLDLFERFGLINEGVEDPITTEDWVKALAWMKLTLDAERAREPAGLLGDDALFEEERTPHAFYYATILLLMLCPNIKRLVFAEESYFILYILRRNNYGLLPEKALQKLKHVELVPSQESSEDRVYIHMDLMRMVQCFHRLPSLESISVAASEINPGIGSRVNFLYRTHPT
jgi:hypothetical protein